MTDADAVFALCPSFLGGQLLMLFVAKSADKERELNNNGTIRT
jgi:hypothetical protein